METIKAGTTLTARSIGDYNCVFTADILERDLKTSLGETIAQRDELLAALKDIAVAVENPKSVNTEMASLSDRVSRVARAAIARAEGRVI